jgi:hypothetical protein
MARRGGTVIEPQDTSRRFPQLRNNSRKATDILWRHTYYEQRTVEEDAGYANKLKRVVSFGTKVSASEMTTRDGESA